MQKVLDEYCPNGVPSKVPSNIILRTNKDGSVVYAPKGSGMYENTNLDNIDINAGGWDCRHIARWTI